MKNLKILSVGYIITVVFLFLYSFTQIDLSLTFSRIEILRNLVKSFQYIGYFNRPLSAALYLLILMALYVCYFLFLFFASKKELTKRYIWKIILVTVVILAFSYNAFSYDLFNYVFDAKIVTHYHQNPYLQKALDYPGDPMLSFMHWTHRVYPYGPIWLVLTVPLSFLGLQLFLPTFFLFKLLMAACFLGSIYFIGKISQKIAPEKERFALLFFALNPLLLIESLVSAHLDIVMIFFSLWGFYLLISKRYISSYALFLLSVGIKFATGFLLPVFLFITYFQQKKKKISWRAIFGSSILLMLIAVIAATIRTNFQPWYLVLVFSFAVFLADSYIVFLPTMILSFAGLLLYVPYLYLGNWDKPVPQILFTIQVVALILSIISIGVYYLLSARKALLLKPRPAAQKSSN